MDKPRSSLKTEGGGGKGTTRDISFPGLGITGWRLGEDAHAKKRPFMDVKKSGR